MTDQEQSAASEPSPERLRQVQAALSHIADAAAGLTRDECVVVETALRAGWLTDEERATFSDLANGFARLSVAGAS